MHSYDISHPVSTSKSGLSELVGSATINTGLELFLEQAADAGELDVLQAKTRGTVSSLTGRDLSSNARGRRALAEAIA